MSGIEIQARSLGAVDGAGPIETIAARKNESAIVSLGIVSATGARQFEHLCESTVQIHAAPSVALGSPFGFGRNAESGRAWIVDTVDTLPKVIVLRAAPIVRAGGCQNEKAVTRVVAIAQCGGAE